MQPISPDVYDREYFLSDLCEGWDRFRDNRGLSAIKERELGLLEPLAGRRVLDAGCGRGEVLRACAARGAASVTGIDYAPAAVEIAREVVPGDVVLGDVCALPFADASFDRLLLADVIEHLTEEQGAVALRELRRVLAPGGRLVVHTAPNRRFTALWPALRLGVPAGARARMDRWLALSERYHAREHSPRTLRRALLAAGFPAPRVWVHRDLLRGGGHHLTADVARSPAGRAATLAATLPPVRALLGNDIYAIVSLP